MRGHGGPGQQRSWEHVQLMGAGGGGAGWGTQPPLASPLIWTHFTLPTPPPPPRPPAQDPHLVPMLKMYKRSGRKLFLATNSLWDYTNVVMNFLVGCAAGVHAARAFWESLRGALAARPAAVRREPAGLGGGWRPRGRLEAPSAFGGPERVWRPRARLEAPSAFGGPERVCELGPPQVAGWTVWRAKAPHA
jgi:hypothetical protein